MGVPTVPRETLRDPGHSAIRHSGHLLAWWASTGRNPVSRPMPIAGRMAGCRGSPPRTLGSHSCPRGRLRPAWTARSGAPRSALTVSGGSVPEPAAPAACRPPSLRSMALFHVERLRKGRGADALAHRADRAGGRVDRFSFRTALSHGERLPPAPGATGIASPSATAPNLAVPLLAGHPRQPLPKPAARGNPGTPGSVLPPHLLAGTTSPAAHPPHLSGSHAAGIAGRPRRHRSLRAARIGHPAPVPGGRHPTGARTPTPPFGSSPRWACPRPRRVPDTSGQVPAGGWVRQTPTRCRPRHRASWPASVAVVRSCHHTARRRVPIVPGSPTSAARSVVDLPSDRRDQIGPTMDDGYVASPSSPPPPPSRPP